MALPEKEPSLDTLLDKTLKRYHHQKSFLYKGKREGYVTGQAAEDVLKASGYSPRELFLSFTEQTTLTPQEVYLDSAINGETWDELILDVCVYILYEEIERQFPGIRDENARRQDYWDSRRR